MNDRRPQTIEPFSQGKPWVIRMVDSVARIVQTELVPHSNLSRTAGRAKLKCNSAFGEW